MVGFASKAEFDKEQAEKNRPQTRWERKKTRILGEAGSLKKKFFAGFLMGGCVGGLMGGMMGTYFSW